MKSRKSVSPTSPSKGPLRTGRVWSGAGRAAPVPFDDETLRVAVREWLQDPAATESKNGHISDWDTSRVRDMSYLFYQANTFNQPLRWDTSKVENMCSLFERAVNFNQPLLRWDTSSALYMNYMFSHASAFNQPLHLDTSHVVEMEGMFYKATAFNQPLAWDTSKVENMHNLFASAVAFNQPLLRWNTSSVLWMGYMFSHASAFNQPLDLDTRNVVDMEGMFNKAVSFNQPLIGWDTINVENLSGMFSDARTFNQPLPWDTRNVRTMNSTFRNAVAFNRLLQWDTRNVDDLTLTFHGATTFDQPLRWNTRNVRRMKGMFQGASAFNQPLPFNTRNVDDMSDMFAVATAFNQPLSHWNTSNVTNMEWMFFRASRFDQPLSNWNTRKVTNMGCMFRGAPLMLARYPDGKLPIDRWQKVRDRFRHERLRWHWQEPCDADRNVPLEDLHEWADEFDIPLRDPTTQRPKTKRALCADLARWWDAQREDQRAVSPTCNNPIGILGENVADIPPEFFYHYTHDDGLVYCDDIRSLHKHVSLSDSPQNPYNRQPYSPELVDDISASYDRLQRRVVHMGDYDDGDLVNVPLPFEARFSQKLADLMTRLYHPVGPERLRGASADVWAGFLDALVDERVLSLNERSQVDAQPDLDQQKYFLVELIALKIDHDPRQIQTPQGALSQIAYWTTIVFNRVFE